MSCLARRVLRLLPLAAGLAWLSILPATSRAQDGAPIAQGTHLFRHILDEKGLIPDADLWQHRGEKLLILFGQTNLPPPERRFESHRLFLLSNFVQEGGAVLIATDRDAGGEGTTFGAVIHGSPLTVRQGSRASYRAEDCIFLTATGNGPRLFQNLTVGTRHLSRVATNRPGYLTLPPPEFGGDMKIVARLPDDTLMAGRPAPSLAFAAAGEWDKGRILVVADHSLFINGMLAQTDNENYEFAENCIDWLTDNGRRNRVIFYDEGARQRDFRLPELTPPPIESFNMDRLIQATDEAVVGMEKEGTLNDLILGALGRSGPDAGDNQMFVGAVLIVLTLGLGGYALARLVGSRHYFESGTPPLADAVQQPIAGTRLPEQRQRALMQQGNYWETARSLARQCFTALWEGDCPPGGGLPNGLGHRHPRRGRIAQGIDWTEIRSPVLVMPEAGTWWQRRRLQASVDSLWRLAQSSSSTSISHRQLVRLKQQIHLVEQALADGRLGLRTGEENG
jgi:hypothetical protein